MFAALASACAGLLDIEDLVDPSAPDAGADAEASVAEPGSGDADADADVAPGMFDGSWCAREASTALVCDDFDVDGTFTGTWDSGGRSQRHYFGELRLANSPVAAAVSAPNMLLSAVQATPDAGADAAPTTREGFARLVQNVDAGVETLVLDAEVFLETTPTALVGLFRVEFPGEGLARSVFSYGYQGTSATLSSFALASDGGSLGGSNDAVDDAVPRGRWLRVRFELDLPANKPAERRYRLFVAGRSLDGGNAHGDARLDLAVSKIVPSTLAPGPMVVEIGAATKGPTNAVLMYLDNVHIIAK